MAAHDRGTADRPLIRQCAASNKIGVHEVSTRLGNCGRPPQNAVSSTGRMFLPTSRLTPIPIIPMGDKSPKANQKKSSQKQAAATSADQKKKQAAASKAASKKK